MSQVGAVIPDVSGIRWVIGGLPLAVYWPGHGMPLYLVSHPWPGDEAGACEIISLAIYSHSQYANDAAREYIAGLPG